LCQSVFSIATSSHLASTGLAVEPIGADSGLPVQGIEQSATPDWENTIKALRLGEHLLSKMEQFYTRFITKPYQRRTYQQQMNTPNQMLAARLKPTAHCFAPTEDYFACRQAQGSLIERCRPRAGWTYIYREICKIKPYRFRSRLSRLDC